MTSLIKINRNKVTVYCENNFSAITDDNIEWDSWELPLPIFYD